MPKNLNRRLPTVPTHQFSMVPRADVPRSTFVSKATYKTTLAADRLVPIMVEEVLPGDSYKGRGQVFLRMATLIFPLMDNVHLDGFFFFVPNRILWNNWQKFMGEQANPLDSIDYLVPQYTPGIGYNDVEGLPDYFGLPTADQLTTPKAFNALPFRAYNRIWNDWFRDENLQDSAAVVTGDGPDDATTEYIVLRRGKRHDYFTSCLPWPQKGDGVEIPMLGLAPVKTSTSIFVSGAQQPMYLRRTDTGVGPGNFQLTSGGASNSLAFNATAGGTPTAELYPANLYADLAEATGATINAMRLAVATQHLLERDARGGTRYTELLRNHFGVDPEDSRLQRPEYIGGGSLTLQTQAIPQTSASDITGSTSFMGQLSGAAVGTGEFKFSYAAREHGFIIGLVAARADLTYQQGCHRMWTRQTRYDYYWPAFAFLGEQAVRQDEIYALGTSADDDTFGYQERWAEYRYRNSLITGFFRSGISGTYDAWHLSEFFSTPPSLNNIFIESNTPMPRVLAAGSAAEYQAFLLDSVWTVSATRPIPTRSVPGLARF